MSATIFTVRWPLSSTTCMDCGMTIFPGEAQRYVNGEPLRGPMCEHCARALLRKLARSSRKAVPE